MGDFNYPNIEWNDLHASNDCSEFLDLVKDNFLYEHLQFPIRENNILDLLLRSDSNMVNKLAVLVNLELTIHSKAVFLLWFILFINEPNIIGGGLYAYFVFFIIVCYVCYILL